MISVGDDGAGFSVTLEMANQVLRVSGHGFWGAEVAREFGPRVRECLLVHPHIPRLFFDFRALKPLRDEGQAGFHQILSSLRLPTPAQVYVQTASPLVKLQLLRIVKECGGVASVEFV